VGVCVVAGAGLSSGSWLSYAAQAGRFVLIGPGVWLTALGGAVALAGGIILGGRTAR
jgi:hypothetical protein